MPNAKSIITSHNRRILANENAKPTTTAEKKCNCQRNRTCPLGLTKNVVYEATVESGSEKKIYIGSTGNDFKTRFNQHNYSFNNKGKSETELSKYIWLLKDKNTAHKISWRIKQRIKGGGKSTRNICTTCNMEKLEIALAKKRDLLNKRSELNSKCPHFRRLYFKCLPKVK